MNRPGRWGCRRTRSERGSGTVLAAALGMVLILATSFVLLLAQSAVLASQTAAAADLAALAAADALRGVSDGDPCAVAASVAARHSARLISCTEGGDQSVEVRTQSSTSTFLGAATGRARAGPPP
ncbi:Rv3654c family TadE-like protein [Arthrobacter sp. D1-17]